MYKIFCIFCIVLGLAGILVHSISLNMAIQQGNGWIVFTNISLIIMFLILITAFLYELKKTVSSRKEKKCLKK
jgi:uncharacterized membrane protein